MELFNNIQMSFINSNISGYLTFEFQFYRSVNDFNHSWSCRDIDWLTFPIYTITLG